MKKLSSKILSVILVVLLLIQILPMSTFAQELSEAKVSSEETVEEATVVGEIEELRTESTKHFKMSDGTYIAATYPEPVHYEVNGEWKEIDNTLVEETIDDQSYFTNKNANNKVTFSESISEDSVKIKSADGYEISLTPVTDKKEAKVKKKDVEDLTSAKALKKQEKADEKMVLKDKKSALKYSDVFEDTDIEYIVTSSTVKENIVVNKPQNKYVYDFTAEFGGLTPSTEADGAIGLYNEEKILVMRIEAPYMYDSTGEVSNNVEITYKEKKDQYIVTVTADKKWINDDAREFPVVIDPTVKLNMDRADINDVYVDSANPTYSHMYSDYLYVGKNSLGTTRTYIKYNLPDLPDCSIVTGAALTLKQYEHDPGSGATNYIYAYDCGTSSWSSETITWNNQPMNKTDLSSYTVLDYQKYVNNTISGNTVYAAEYVFDITKAAKNWYENGINNGIMLASADTSITKKSRFCSSEFSTDSQYFPSVWVSYVNNSGVEDYWTYQTVDLGRSGCAYIGDYNGTFTYIHDDVSTYGNRMPASVSHIYSSDRTYFSGSYGNMRFGVGFKLNVLEQIVPIGSSSSLYDDGYRAKHIDSDGTVHYFKSTDTANKFAHEFNEKLTITKLTNNRFLMEDESGNKKEFSTGGFLLSATDSNSNKTTIVYSADWKQITKIVDGAGKEITFTYDSDNYLLTISRQGRRIAFIYAYNSEGVNTGYLRSIRYPDNKTTTFYYGGPGGRLDNIVSYDTSDVKFTYKTVNCKTTAFYRISAIETRGRLVDGARSTINKLTYTYGIGETKITDRYGKANYIYFDNAGRTINIRDHEANSSYARYNSSGNKANTLALQSGTYAHINNLVKNNSADFIDNGEWYQQIAGAGAGSATISTDYAYIGYKSFKVTNTTTSGGVNFCQALTITPGTDYTLSAYVKIPSTLTGGTNSGVCLGYSYEAADGTWTTVYDETIKASTDWKRISYTFSLPSDATGDIGIKLIIKHTSGTVYFDCVQFEKGSTMNRYNLLDNSGFDYNSLHWATYSNTSSDGIISSGIDGKSMRIFGAPGARKSVYQDVQINGKAGDTVVFGAWAKANAAGQANSDPGTPTFRAELTVEYTDGTKEYPKALFDEDVSQSQFVCSSIKLSKDCKAIRLYMTYYYDVNNAVFDNACLYLDNFGSSYQYDDDGKLVSVSDGTGYGITYTYRGPDITKISQTFDGEEVDGITYDYDDGEAGENGEEDEGNTHNILSETTKNGIVTKYEYTPREGETSTYGNPTRVTVTSADKTKFSECKMEYTDDYNYLHTVIDSREGTTVYEYNEYNGNLKSVTDPNGNVTTYDYDYVTEELICTGGRASSDSYMTFNYYSYEDDQLYSINHNGFNYIFNYDSFGRTTSTSVAGQTLISHSYNADSTINKSTYGNGDSVSYAYDTLDRVTSLSYNDVKTYEYDYNREGQVAREKDYDNNITTEYEYDLAQRLTGAYSSNGLRANYTYDERNNIKDLAVTKNGTVLANNTFTYQDDGLINSVSLPLLDNSTLSYAYDNLNRTSEKLIDLPSEHLTDYSSQIYTEYHYLSRIDRVNRTLVQTGLVSGMTVVSAINDNGDEFECDWYNATYTYDANGNITTVNQNGAVYQTYTYDGLNQLIRHDDAVAGASYTYSYDDGGNIISKSEYDYSTGDLGEPVETVNYTYDSSWKDKLVSYDGKAVTYDAIGNPLTYDGYTFSWQKGRQLESISGNGVNLSFKYNSDGLRTKKISPTSTTEYYYSGDILLAQYDGTDWMKFIYSADGEIVGLRYKDKSYYYIKNLQGDVIGILDELADIVCDYHYDAWGQCSISIPAGLTDDAIELANKNPIRYRGYYYDTETELYYACSRYYHPEWGRFVNPDTVDVVTASLDEALYDKNLFAYCDNNPTVRIDADGYFWETAFDIVSLGFSVVEVASNPDDIWNWAGLACDLIDLVPFATGLGESVKIVKVSKKVSNASDIAGKSQKALRKADFYITPLGDAIPATRKGFEANLSKLEKNNGKFYGQDLNGFVRIRVEKHTPTPNYKGPQNPFHCNQHFHIDKRINGTTGPFKSTYTGLMGWLR